MGSHVKPLTKTKLIATSIGTSGVEFVADDGVLLGIIVSNFTSGAITLNFDVSFDGGTTYIPISGNTISVAAYLSAGPPIVPSKQYYSVTINTFKGLTHLRVRTASGTLDTCDAIVYVGEV